MLVIEERRKVMRDSTISLYGHRYRVPPGYINCRIWVKIIGDKVIFSLRDPVRRGDGEDHLEAKVEGLALSLTQTQRPDN